MLYEKLWETAVRDEWRSIVADHQALAVGIFIVVATLIWDRIRTWKRTRRMESELRKIERKIYILEMQESGRLSRLVRELNTKSRVKIETSNGEETAPAVSHLPTVGQG